MVEDKKGAEPTNEFGDDRAEFLPPWPRDPKSGDFVETFVGNIVSKDTVKDVAGLDGGEPRDVDLYTVADENGEQFTIWGGGMLARVLPPHIGHRVRIEDLGKELLPDGKSLRRFDVRCATCTAAGK